MGMLYSMCKVFPLIIAHLNMEQQKLFSDYAAFRDKKHRLREISEPKCMYSFYRIRLAIHIMR